MSDEIMTLTWRAKRIVAEAGEVRTDPAALQIKIIRLLALMVEALDKPREPEP